jgi:hypothetical protein
LRRFFVHRRFSFRERIGVTASIIAFVKSGMHYIFSLFEC